MVAAVLVRFSENCRPCFIDTLCVFIYIYYIYIIGERGRAEWFMYLIFTWLLRVIKNSRGCIGWILKNDWNQAGEFCCSNSWIGGVNVSRNRLKCIFIFKCNYSFPARWNDRFSAMRFYDVSKERKENFVDVWKCFWHLLWCYSLFELSKSWQLTWSTSLIRASLLRNISAWSEFVVIEFVDE